MDGINWEIPYFYLLGMIRLSDFFGRKIVFVVGTRTITNDLDITFDIEFDDGPDVNISEVKIYNLTTETIMDLKKNSWGYINAGYGSDIGGVLTGVIKDVKTVWEGADRLTTVTMADTSDSWLTKEINKTYKTDVTAKQILTDAVNASSLKLGKISLPTNKVYKGGKTIKVFAHAIVRKILFDHLLQNAKIRTCHPAVVILISISVARGVLPVGIFYLLARKNVYIVFFTKSIYII